MDRLVGAVFSSEDLIILESMAQDFGFTGVLGKQAHSGLHATVVQVRLWSQKTSQTRVLFNSRSLTANAGNIRG